MSIYPVFDEISIENRFNRDIIQFAENFYPNTPINNIQSKYIICKDNLTHYIEFKKVIDDLIMRINTIRDNTDFSTFNYSKEIMNLTNNRQKELWCIRTLLFYQLLIFITKMMKNENIFNSVYQNYRKKRIFNDIIIPELQNYKMGIFGSITPSSDIDIGIEYSGDDSYLLGLSYIVSIFEDSFLIFTGRNSLDFDIETYADIITIKNFDKHLKKQHPDIFYLDTSNLEKRHFDRLIPYIETGILKNYITARHELGDTSSIRKIVDLFSYSDFYNKLQQANVSLPYYIKKEYSPDSSIQKIQDKSRQLIIDCMNQSYDETREKYYRSVNNAEISIQFVKEQNKRSNTIVLTPEQVTKIIEKFAKTRIYRSESYICAPTVMHVVRVLQANAKNPTKYKTIEPCYCIINKSTDAYCNIGKYGYIISIYEQLGYIYRFFLTYCQGRHKNPIKCKKKINKYNKRVKNAVEILNNRDINLQECNINKKSSRKQMRKTRRKTTRKTRQIKKSKI